MSGGTLHIVGAGLAGLSAAVALVDTGNKVVIHELARHAGGRCRSYFEPALVEPAVAYVEERAGEVRFDHGVRSIAWEGERARALQFADEAVELGRGDRLVLAVPAWVAKTLLPELRAPSEYRSIFNAHFAFPAPKQLPKITGVINATTEWLFAFENRLSVTVSSADRFNEAEREPMARHIWSEISQIAGLDAEMPRWQIVKERRATFAATPEQNELRPRAETRWRNVFLAGDWTATGLPATIEGAIRSGETAAKLAMAS